MMIMMMTYWVKLLELDYYQKDWAEGEGICWAFFFGLDCEVLNGQHKMNQENMEAAILRNKTHQKL